jgi:hypothetical protein
MEVLQISYNATSDIQKLLKQHIGKIIKKRELNVQLYAFTTIDNQICNASSMGINEKIRMYDNKNIYISRKINDNYIYTFYTRCSLFTDRKFICDGISPVLINDNEDIFVNNDLRISCNNAKILNCIPFSLLFENNMHLCWYLNGDTIMKSWIPNCVFSKFIEDVESKTKLITDFCKKNNINDIMLITIANELSSQNDD